MKVIRQMAVAVALSAGLVSVAEAHVFVGVGIGVPMVPVLAAVPVPPSMRLRLRRCITRRRLRVRAACCRWLLRASGLVVRAPRVWIWIRLLALVQAPEPAIKSFAAGGDQPGRRTFITSMEHAS